MKLLTELFIHSTRRAAAHHCERGQSTVEYALLLVGVAAIALLVVTWATGSDAIPRLFDAVFGNIVDNV